MAFLPLPLPLPPLSLQDELNLPYPDAHPVQTSIASCVGFVGGAVIASLPVLLSRFQNISIPHRSALTASVAVAAAAAATANFVRCDSKNLPSRRTLVLGCLSCAAAVAATFSVARAAMHQ